MRPANTGREQAVDWARGVAALAMIEGHALHSWVSAPGKQTQAYEWTRLVATSPLPAFLLLAGISVRLRLGLGQRRCDEPSRLRATIVRRGVEVVFWGYAMSAACALLDGHNGLRTFLRSDVLHVIGLSIAALGIVCLSGGGAIDPSRAVRRVAWLAAVITAVSPVYYSLVPAPIGAIRYLLAPLVHVPGVSVFALLPILGWAAMGVVVGDLVARARQGFSERTVYGALVAAGLLVATTCELLTRAMLGTDGMLSVVHPAAAVNMVGYAARGAVLIGVGALLPRLLPRAGQAFVARLGRSSLVAYMFHLPFCYGTLAAGLKGRLSVPESAPWVVLLWLASYAAVRLVSAAASSRSLQAVREGLWRPLRPGARPS